MPDDDSVRTELDEGELITMPFCSLEHGHCAGNITYLLNYAKKQRFGRVYAGRTGFRLSDYTVRAPDAAFVRQERVESVHRRGFGNGAPDLAIEVFSPSDSVRQLMRKVKQYFRGRLSHRVDRISGAARGERARSLRRRPPAAGRRPHRSAGTAAGLLGTGLGVFRRVGACRYRTPCRLSNSAARESPACSAARACRHAAE